MQYVIILHLPTGKYVNVMEHPNPVYFTTTQENSSFSTDFEYYLDDEPLKFLNTSDRLASAFYFLDLVHGMSREEFELIYRGPVSCVKYQIIKHSKNLC